MKDYEIAYKLSSIMDSLTGGAACFDDGYEQVHLSIPASRIMALESYGIKEPHKILYDIFDKKGFNCVIDDDDIQNLLVTMVSLNLNDYKELALTFYEFCKEIASITDNIMIKLEEENRVLVDSPIISLFRDNNKENSKEFMLFMNLITEAMTDTFGKDSFESVGIRIEELRFLHIGKYSITIDFIDRDSVLKEIDDIQKISKLIADCTLKALDIIFEEYLD